MDVCVILFYYYMYIPPHYTSTPVLPEFSVNKDEDMQILRLSLQVCAVICGQNANTTGVYKKLAPNHLR